MSHGKNVRARTHRSREDNIPHIKKEDKLENKQVMRDEWSRVSCVSFTGNYKSHATRKVTHNLEGVRPRG